METQGSHKTSKRSALLIAGVVLSGILAAVAAFAPDPLLGTAAAAYINGRAGELAQSRKGSVSMVAGDTVACIPEVVYSLEKMDG